MSRALATGRSHKGRDESVSTIPAIEFRHVDFSYDDNAVLDDLSFQVAKGEIKIILSGSGGGKSTILKLILGLLKPDAGRSLLMVKKLPNSMKRSYSGYALRLKTIRKKQNDN